MSAKRSYSIQMHDGLWSVAYEYDAGECGFNQPLGLYLSLWAAYLRIASHALYQTVMAVLRRSTP